MRQLRLPAGLAVALILAGCGLTDPYTSQHLATTGTSTSTSTASTTATATNADPAPERGGTIPKGAQAAQNNPAAGAGSPTPQAALERYANLDSNWTAKSVAVVQDQLAAISLGQARAQALQAEASAARDTQLTQSHLANHGQVLAVSPGQAAAAGKWVIVTREQTTGESDYQGLPATLHIIYAQVTRTESGWVVSEWAPQN
jgi:hypothetical protein